MFDETNMVNSSAAKSISYIGLAINVDYGLKSIDGYLRKDP